METLLSTELTVSVSQISMVLLVSTILLIFGRVRLALLAAYCFILYWAKPWNFDLYSETIPARLNGPDCLFIAFCIITTLLAITGLAFNKD